MKQTVTNPALRKTLAIAAAAGLGLALCGCGTGVTAPANSSPPSVSPRTVSGKLHGGQQAISGATIQLYAVGIAGLKSAATPLITATILSDANGSFSITGDWNCTSNIAAYGANPQLYIVATGGNPGLAAGTNNPAIAAMAALGPCDGLTPSTFIFIDEVTTVAAVYALAPFMSDYAHIGGQGANSPGLVNAFKTAAILANTSTGTTPGAALPPNASVPLAEINTLANLIAGCINSTGTDAACSGLFDATTSGGPAPTDTIAALLTIAHNPGRNVGTLFDLVLPSAPFQPVLNSTPNDWTLALSFSGGGLNAPAAIALDANGNGWVANAGGDSVTEFSGTGILLTGPTGYSGTNNLFGAQGIAVDRQGNVWIANTLLSTVVKLNVSGGTVQTSTSYAAGGISGPTGIAIDSQDNVWVSNFAGGSVTELTSAGAVAGASPLTAGGTLQNPVGLAFDTFGNAWFVDNVAGLVGRYSNNQTLLSGAGYTGVGLLAPTGIAIDTSGRAWVANSGTNAVSLFSADGSPLSGSPLTGGGLNMPAGLAIDGSGVVWVTNAQTVGSLSELAFDASSPLSPTTGFGSLNQPMGIAIDASGSVWTVNAGDNTVSVFVGLGTPVMTPIAGTVGP